MASTVEKADDLYLFIRADFFFSQAALISWISVAEAVFSTH